MPDPESMLRAGRFELWRPTAADHAALHGLTLDPAMRRFLGNHEPNETDSFARLYRNAGSWALHGYGTFLVREVGRSELVGHCGVFRSWRGLPGMNDVAEAGWIIGQEWWGQGVASCIMETVLDWFDRTHGRQRIACMIEQGNVASERLAANLGFVPFHQHPGDDGRMLVLSERLPGLDPLPPRQPGDLTERSGVRAERESDDPPRGVPITPREAPDCPASSPRSLTGTFSAVPPSNRQVAEECAQGPPPRGTSPA